MSAVISACGLYRYRLERVIEGALQAAPSIAWIMVNPSTADAAKDDQTIKKVRGFSRLAGAGRIVVGNLFAFRSKDVRLLRDASDPIGPENDTHLRAIIQGSEIVVVAWGSLGKLPRSLRERWRDVVRIADGKTLMCIGIAKDGHPLHPQMEGYANVLRPWLTPAGRTIHQPQGDANAHPRDRRSASSPRTPAPPA
ncbi:DUF1643 domain-containing protein [Methylobacterium aquaticum]|uniref:DUF1643 domain-containing protein n=1 Tax=Methylobacterium aquaticum TaxID=270351 RepID=UPI0009E5CE94|nr:DUF1643 domain-containing protein [Methylobacterium aquaticum]